MNTMSDEVYWAIMEVGLARKSLDKALYAVESYLGGQRDDELLQIAVDYLLCGNGRHLHEAEKTMNELVQKRPRGAGHAAVKQRFFLGVRWKVGTGGHAF